MPGEVRACSPLFGSPAFVSLLLVCSLHMPAEPVDCPPAVCFSSTCSSGLQSEPKAESGTYAAGAEGGWRPKILMN